MTPSSHIRLGVNIDHVATLRNARGGTNPDPIRAARASIAGGADSITVHLREDRRHIRDADVAGLLKEIAVPLNLEMAVTPEMVAIAERLRPHAVCLVPEKREEVTTEGGLDVASREADIAEATARLAAAGCRVSLFIDPDLETVRAAARIRAAAVEFHTGAFCERSDPHELQRLLEAARLAHGLGLECHAGHGLDYDTARPVGMIPEIVELNIGHFLVGEALFVGLEAAIRKMVEVLRLAGETRSRA